MTYIDSKQSARFALWVMGLTHAIVLLAACSLYARHVRSQASQDETDFDAQSDALVRQFARLEPDSRREHVADWADQVIRMPHMALLVVFDGQDRPIIVADTDPRFRQALGPLWQSPPRQSMGVFETNEVRRSPSRFPFRFGRMESHSVPGNDMALLVVGGPDLQAGGPFSIRAWTRFYLPLLLTTATSLTVALVWLNRHALAPLVALVRVARRAHHTQLEEEGIAETAPTLGALIHVLDQLQRKNRHWYQEAARLRHTFDRRLDAKTRHIARDLRKAFKEAATDPLTGVGNRRVLDDNLGALMVGSLEAQADLCLVMIDLDEFKALNDQYGHKAGDEVLRFVGDLLAGSIRGDDMVIRMGGDEFLLVLPGVGADEAQAIAERLVLLFRQHCSAFALDPPLTLSAGVVSLQDWPQLSPSEFLERGDQALYVAKEYGKNRVFVFNSELHHPFKAWAP